MRGHSAQPMILRTLLFAATLVLGQVMPAAAAGSWILMVPPVANGIVDPSAPVSQWLRVRTADTAEECATFKEQLDAMLKAVPSSSAEPGNPEHQRIQDLKAARGSMRCVPATGTDPPR